MSTVEGFHLERLKERIANKREEMILQANLSGYTSDATIEVSQQLDALINIYQQLTYNNCAKKHVLFRKYIKQTILFFYGTKLKLNM
jgi:stage 0 sporulation regulatory protein